MRQVSTSSVEQNAIAQPSSTFTTIEPATSIHETTSHSVASHDDYSSQDSEGSKDTVFAFSNSDMSQSTRADPIVDEVTPPSSRASPQKLSVQDREHSPAKSAATLHFSTVAEPQPGRPATQSPPRSPALHESPAGAKRTASGQVKRASINSIADLLPRPGTATSSKQGNASVTELSQQLRTRLTYAMVKVQHGWESRSLHEVESLASQSPRSAVSGFTHTIDGRAIISPRSAMTARLQRKWSSSDSSEGNAPTEARSTVPFTTEAPSSQAMGQSNPARKSLAPPVDIVPSSHRRRMTPNGHNSSSMKPPSMRPLATQRTPSQNAVLEAEAVETLAFMASPSTSSTFPGGSQSSNRSNHPFLTQASPLGHAHPAGASNMMSPKRVAFSSNPNNLGSSREAVVDKTALINRMLDEIDADDGVDAELERAFAIADRASSGLRAP